MSSGDVSQAPEGDGEAAALARVLGPTNTDVLEVLLREGITLDLLPMVTKDEMRTMGFNMGQILKTQRVIDGLKRKPATATATTPRSTTTRAPAAKPPTTTSPSKPNSVSPAKPAAPARPAAQPARPATTTPSVSSPSKVPVPVRTTSSTKPVASPAKPTTPVSPPKVASSVPSFARATSSSASANKPTATTTTAPPPVSPTRTGALTKAAAQTITYTSSRSSPTRTTVSTPSKASLASKSASPSKLPLPKSSLSSSSASSRSPARPSSTQALIAAAPKSAKAAAPQQPQQPQQDSFAAEESTESFEDQPLAMPVKLFDVQNPDDLEVDTSAVQLSDFSATTSPSSATLLDSISPVVANGAIDDLFVQDPEENELVQVLAATNGLVHDQEVENYGHPEQNPFAAYDPTEPQPIAQQEQEKVEVVVEQKQAVVEQEVVDEQKQEVVDEQKPIQQPEPVPIVEQAPFPVALEEVQLEPEPQEPSAIPLVDAEPAAEPQEPTAVPRVEDEPAAEPQEPTAVPRVEDEPAAEPQEPTAVPLVAQEQTPTLLAQQMPADPEPEWTASTGQEDLEEVAPVVEKAPEFVPQEPRETEPVQSEAVAAIDKSKPFTVDNIQAALTGSTTEPVYVSASAFVAAVFASTTVKPNALLLLDHALVQLELVRQSDDSGSNNTDAFIAALDEATDFIQSVSTDQQLLVCAHEYDRFVDLDAKLIGAGQAYIRANELKTPLADRLLDRKSFVDSTAVLLAQKHERVSTDLQLALLAAEWDKGGSIHDRFLDHPRLRVLWKSTGSFKGRERVPIADFFAALSQFIAQHEQRPNALDQTAKDQLKSLFHLLDPLQPNSVNIQTVNAVFPPAICPTHRISDLLELVTAAGDDIKPIQLRALPRDPTAFVPRGELATKAQSIVVKGESVAWLTGPKGAGKSTLAVSLARSLVDTFKLVYYVDLAGVPAAAAPFVVLSVVNPTGLNLDINALHTWAANRNRRTRTLLVLDNFNLGVNEQVPWLAQLNRHDALSILVTSRSPAPAAAAAAASIATPVVVDLLSPEQADELMRKINPYGFTATTLYQQYYAAEVVSMFTRAFVDSDYQSAALQDLAVFRSAPFDTTAALAVIGLHDLAADAPSEQTRALFRSLIQAGLVVPAGSPGHYTLAKPAGSPPSDTAIHRFNLYFVGLLGQAASLFNSPNVTAAFALLDRHRAHLDVLLLDSHLSASELPLLLEALVLSDTMLGTRWTDRQLDNVFFPRVAATAESSEEGKLLPEHHLVLAWALHTVHRDRAVELLKSAASSLSSSLLFRLTSAAVWLRDAAKLDSHDASQHAAALAAGQTALQLYTALLGGDSLPVARSLSCIAAIHEAKGAYALALDHYERSLAIRLAVQGKHHPDTAAMYARIGHVRESQGNDQAALESYSRQMEICEAVYGPNHPVTAVAFCDIGGVYTHLGEHQRALDYYNKDLAISETVLGKQHATTAKSYDNIGLVYRSQKDAKRALEFLGKALAIRESLLGKNHPQTAVSYANIASVHSSQKDYVLALELHNKALEIREGVLGKEHPDTAKSYSQLASLHQAEPARALDLYRNALAIREHALGNDHPDTATSHYNVALLEKALGDHASALKHMRLAYAAYVNAFGATGSSKTEDSLKMLQKWTVDQQQQQRSPSKSASSSRNTSPSKGSPKPSPTKR